MYAGIAGLVGIGAWAYLNRTDGELSVLNAS